MSYLLNYKNWRAVFEAAIVKGTGIKPGNELSGLPAAIPFTKEENSKAWEIAKRTVGAEAIPKMRVNLDTRTAVETSIGDNPIQVFSSILDGISLAVDKPIDHDNIKACEEFAAKANITVSKGSAVQLYGPGLMANSADPKIGWYKAEPGAKGSQWRVDTIGKVSSFEAKEGKTDHSHLEAMCSYINTFNLENWRTGDFTQYDPSKILNADKIVDLTAASPAIVNQPGYLMLVGLGEVSTTAGQIDKKQGLTQGEAAKTGSVAISFTTGSADTDDGGVKVDAKHPKVQEIGKKITDYLGETGVIDSMVLTSSASPDYNAKGGGPATLADYATKKKPTSGNAAPASVVDFYDQNAKLAYDRGVTFSNALQQYLGGHLKANSIKVAWKISTDEPGGGKNISYSIATQSVAPQKIETTEFQGAKVTTNRQSMTIYPYTVKYESAALGKEIEKGGLLKKGMVPYEKLKVGDQIIIKNSTGQIELGGKKDKDKVTISKIENNKIYINYKQQKDVEIPKERYISQLGKAAEEAPPATA